MNLINILEEAKNIEKDIIAWRRDLHQIPELGLELPKTSRYIQEKLSDMNIEYETMLYGNAIVGIIRGGEKGKTIALRGDMDGLPIKEETGLSFASTNGNMHACGHDGHMAILLGTAKLINKHREKLKGNIKLFFQPGEEYPGGALPMIDAGAMENPKVDAVLGLHLGLMSKEVKKGNIGVSYGPIMASMDRLLIKIIGKGAHGAYPELSVDPISISAELISSLQRVVSREIPAVESAVLSLTKIHGGFNQNIIPAKVEIEGTVRTLNNDVREFIARRVEEITKGITRAMRADYEVQYDFKYPPLINSKEFTKKMVDSAEKVIGRDRIQEITKPSMGAEDIAFFLEKAPGTFFFLSNPKEVNGKIYPHHHPKFDIDESFLYMGVLIFLQTTFDFLA